MIAAVIGCGDSGKAWFEHLFDEAYGCNDAAKHGHNYFNSLVLLNSPHKFGPDRLRVIKNTLFDVVQTHSKSAWAEHFTPGHSVKTLKMSEFNPHGRIKRELIYKSKTSPFVAMSLAFHHGAEEINLFGVDFNDHKTFKKGDRMGDREIGQYAKFAELAAAIGCKIRVTKESALSQFIDTI